MNVDIYVKEREGSREIRIPWLPESITYKSGGVISATYDIMNRGDVAVPTGSGLASVSWQSLFPGVNRTDASMMRGEWFDPKHYHNILEDWKKNGTPLNIIATGYPINLDVFLDNYEADATGGFGDWEYELSFTEDRDFTITSTKTSDNQPKRAVATSDTYIIKPGDTLWTIAQQQLKSGAKWESIYNANKEIIESTAKKRWKAAGINRDSEHGHWIFPGTSIKIPK